MDERIHAMDWEGPGNNIECGGMLRRIIDRDDF